MGVGSSDPSRESALPPSLRAPSVAKGPTGGYTGLVIERNERSGAQSGGHSMRATIEDNALFCVPATFVYDLVEGVAVYEDERCRSAEGIYTSR